MMCGPADDQRTLQPLPDWLVQNTVPIRCLPALGVHEWCEHDPDHPPPSFRGLSVAELVR